MGYLQSRKVWQKLGEWLEGSRLKEMYEKIYRIHIKIDFKDMIFLYWRRGRAVYNSLKWVLGMRHKDMVFLFLIMTAITKWLRKD